MTPCFRAYIFRVNGDTKPPDTSNTPVEPYTSSHTLTQVTVLLRCTDRLTSRFGNLRQHTSTSVLARARTARFLPRGPPLGNSYERLSSVRGASWAAPTPAERSPPACPRLTPIYDTIGVCVRSRHTTLAAAATQQQNTVCNTCVLHRFTCVFKNTGGNIHPWVCFRNVCNTMCVM